MTCIPSSSFPHIVESILAYAIADADDPLPFVSLRLVCSDWRSRIDTALGYHLLAVECTIKPEDPRFWTLSGKGVNMDDMSKQVEFVNARLSQPAFMSSRPGARGPEGKGEQRLVLRSALFPDRNVADLTLEESVYFVKEARVLTARVVLESPETIERLCPRLHTVRLRHHGKFEPDRRNLPKASHALPRAETYVWLGSPDEQYYFFWQSPVWRARSRPTRASLCHSETKKLVIVNHVLRPPWEGRPPLSRTARPFEGLQEIVLIQPHADPQGLEQWVFWSYSAGASPKTTIVVDAETDSDAFSAIRTRLEEVKSRSDASIPTLEAMGFSVTRHDFAARFVAARDYRERVGDETYRVETEIYLSQTEKNNDLRNIP